MFGSESWYLAGYVGFFLASVLGQTGYANPRTILTSAVRFVNKYLTVSKLTLVLNEVLKKAIKKPFGFRRVLCRNGRVKE